MIHWTLTEQQADIVLNALGQRPFIEVQGLIGVLMQQAQQQQKQAQDPLTGYGGTDAGIGQPAPQINGAVQAQ